MAEDNVTQANAFQGSIGLTEAELDIKYPNRPHNKYSPLLFRDLIFELFKPLNENKQKAPPNPWRRKVGPRGATNPTPHEERRLIIERFINRWRCEVGPDMFSVFRLILPDKDRERAIYGLKERAIAKLLVRIIKINIKTSADAQNLLNWKLPGQSSSGVTTSGDFAARCQQVLTPRQMISKPGDMDIDEVNHLLDKLSVASKEDAQIPVFETFYQRMSAEELMWLIRIILRQTKVGASEKTFFDVYHPDADRLFNVCSNLRRVCWELHDRDIHLEPENADVNLMQCFQPQLAQFQAHNFDRMVRRLLASGEENEFWIEEKLDGERMQLHMCQDSIIDGGLRFAFFSRKGKDYTYLYGSHLEEGNSALTKHLGGAFHSGVRNIILDGEMITFDTVLNKIVGFGTLKTAALAAKKETKPDEDGQRPVLKLFDILLLNDKVLTGYELKERRKALEGAVVPVPNRLEVHTYEIAKDIARIDPALREVVADRSEGLVLKNPRSAYRLNSRNDDWVKVKPEYMSEYGEALDCVVVGGYYGSGRRGGTLSSFLCGLIIDEHMLHKDNGDKEGKCWSFFKVGGGFAKSDYDQIHDRLKGNWKVYDKSKPPTDYLELGGGTQKQYEAPDVWIPASQSVVISVRAASVHRTEQFRTTFTLRFPRFKGLRTDRAWHSALTLEGWAKLKSKVEEEVEGKKFELEKKRKRTRKAGAGRKGTTIAGAMSEREMRDLEAKWAADGNDPTKKLFDGLTFLNLSECIEPKKYKRSKADIEAFVKAHGGKITQRAPKPDTYEEGAAIPVSDKDVIKVNTLKAKGKGVHSVIRPRWLFECVEQAKYDALMYKDNDAPRLLLPYEPVHVKYIAELDKEMVGNGADEFGDSFTRDLDIEELREVVSSMPKIERMDLDVDNGTDSVEDFLQELEGRGRDEFSELKGWMFRRQCTWFDDEVTRFDTNEMDGIEGLEQSPKADVLSAKTTVRFTGGTVANDWRGDITHIVVSAGCSPDRSNSISKALAKEKPRGKLPRLVTATWISESWSEGTRLDEERFTPA